MIRRSLATAVVVGGLLFGVNSGETVWRDGPTAALGARLLFTMLVPFVVSLVSAAATRAELEASSGAPDEGDVMRKMTGGARGDRP